MLSKKHAWLYAALSAGFIGGLFNGLFGTGGGIAFVLFLSMLYKNGDAAKNERRIFATTNAVVLVLSLCSLGLYWLFGRLTTKVLKDGAVYLIASLPGGLFGAVLLSFFKPRYLKKLFAAILLFGGMQILLSCSPFS